MYVFSYIHFWEHSWFTHTQGIGFFPFAFSNYWCIGIHTFLKNFIEVYLIYNVLISAIQQSDSVVHIYSFSYSFPLWFITGY